MEIRLYLNELEPPSGSVRRLPGPESGSDGESATFTGWLGLLGVLSKLIEQPS